MPLKLYNDFLVEAWGSMHSQAPCLVALTHGIATTPVNSQEMRRSVNCVYSSSTSSAVASPSTASSPASARCCAAARLTAGCRVQGRQAGGQAGAEELHHISGL